MPIARQVRIRRFPLLIGIIWFSAACTLPITEPEDFEPRIQNQRDVPIDVYEFPYGSPDEATFLTQLDPWDVYVFDVRGCSGQVLVARVDGTEVARTPYGRGLCLNHVWKVRGVDSVVGDNGPADVELRP